MHSSRSEKGQSGCKLSLTRRSAPLAISSNLGLVIECSTELVLLLSGSTKG